MKSLSEDIKSMLEYLESESSGFAFFPIFVGKEPAEPANTITLFDTPGFSPQLTMDRTEKYEYPSVQIRIRANKYQEGWEQVEEIKNSLHGRANETWDETFYSLIRCVNGPSLLDYDKNQRVRFIINFDCQRR